jgi:hypothetical protein
MAGVDVLFSEAPEFGSNDPAKNNSCRHLLYLLRSFLYWFWWFSLGASGRCREFSPPPPHELLIARSGSHGVVCPAHLVYELGEQTSLCLVQHVPSGTFTCLRKSKKEGERVTAHMLCGDDFWFWMWPARRKHIVQPVLCVLHADKTLPWVDVFANSNYCCIILQSFTK